MGRIHTSVEGLDTRLKAIGTGLEGNRDTLASNATSLGQLGDSVEAMATRLDSGVIEDSLGDIQKVIVVVLLVFTAWSLVPAVGALVGGLWLRRELEATRTHLARRPDRRCLAELVPERRARPRASRSCRGRRRPGGVDDEQR